LTASFLRESRMGCIHNRILTPGKGAVLLTGLSYHVADS